MGQASVLFTPDSGPRFELTRGRCEEQPVLMTTTSTTAGVPVGALLCKKRHAQTVIAALDERGDPPVVARRLALRAGVAADERQRRGEV